MRLPQAVLGLLVAASAAAVRAEEPVASLLLAPEPAAAALRERFGASARLLSLELRPAGFTVEVQDPAIPSHVDRFTFEEGVIEGPEPVRVGRNQKQLKAQLFPLADVDFSLMPRLVADAIERGRTEDGKVSHVRIERNEGYNDYPTWGPPTLRVYVDGPRSGAFVEYGLDGRKRDVKRW